MSEVQENIQAAVANAAAKIAEADTVQEAQQWQSVISNLTSALNQVGEAPVDPVVNNVVDTPVSSPEIDTFVDHGEQETGTEDDKKVDAENE